MAAIDTTVQIFSTLWTVLFYSSPLLIPLLIFVYAKVLRRWPIIAEIIEIRSDNVISTSDRLRRTADLKDGGHKYVFKKSKGESIDIVNFDWVLHCVTKPTNLFEKIGDLMGVTMGKVYLLKYGSKQYKPIHVKAAMKQVDFEVVDWDNMNFMAREQEIIIEKWKEKKSWIAQFIVPLAFVAGGVMIFIFAAYFGTELWKAGQVSCRVPSTEIAKPNPNAPNVNNPAANIPVAGELLGPGA